MTFPVESVLGDVRAALCENRSVVLVAPPGSGKTTCVPPAMMDLPFLASRKTVMLEPRRLAARNAARWIAAQRGEQVGESVGYQVRLEKKVSAATRLEIVTEGLLARRFAHDAELSDTGLLFFDEFHERSLHCDFAFALAVDVRRALRNDLRIAVMSATLDPGRVAEFLGDAVTIRAEGRMFPVTTHWMREESQAPSWALAARGVRKALETASGDILAFLPGEGEIRRAAEELAGTPGADVMPLYGALPREEQDRAFAPAHPGRRKVVLSTSIAETSLTIDGIRAVVDTGYMRLGRFSPASGMNRLETLRITRDRADQRRGRAGRTAPGDCFRM